VWQRWRAPKQSYRRPHISRLLRRGIREGLFRSDLNVEEMAQIRVAQLDLLLNGTCFRLTEFSQT
jgi:hypothetical protein